MKKIFTLLTAMVISIAGYADTVVLSPATVSAYANGSTTFKEPNAGYSMSMDASKKSGKVTVGDVDYIKYSSGIQYTIALPSDIEVTSINFQGRTRKTDGTGGYIAEVNGTEYGKTDYTCGDLYASEDCNHTFTFDVPVTTSLTFTIRNTESIYNITLEVQAKGASDTREKTSLEYSSSAFTYVLEESSELPVLTVSPEAILSSVKYASSDDAVATVDENGVVTPLALGKTTITATFEGDATYAPSEASYVLSVALPATHASMVSFGVDGQADQGTSKDGTTTEGTVTIPQLNNTKFNTYDLANAWGADNSNYIMLSADGGFKAGDVVTVKGVINNKDAAKRGAIKVYGDTQSNVLFVSDDFVNIYLDKESAIEPVVFYLTEDAEVLYIGRDGNTKTSIFYISVERAKKPISAPAIAVDGEDLADTSIDVKTGSHVVTLTHDADVDIYYLYEVAVEEGAEALASEPTMEYNGKTYTLYTEPITVEKAGSLSYFAHSNGVVSALSTIAVNDTTTGIADIDVDSENAPVEYFNMQGIRVANPQNGLYIRRQGNKVEKVYVK